MLSPLLALDCLNSKESDFQEIFLAKIYVIECIVVQIVNKFKKH